MYPLKRVFLAAIVLLAAKMAVPLNSSAQTAPTITAHEHAVRANDALKAGKPDKAIPEFEAIVALDPSNVDAQANLGVLLYFQQQFGSAAEHLRVAVEH